MKNHIIVLGLCLAYLGCANAQKTAKAPSPALVISKSRPVTIVLPVRSTLSEETAAAEVSAYLTRITGAESAVVREGNSSKLNGTPIYIGSTRFAARHVPAKPAFADEEWLMQRQGNVLILTGGRPRGTLYAAYRFLEDIGGVRWWNPWEESVPKKNAITIQTLKRRGQPSINYRDIYAIFARDGGRFAARSRLDRQGFEPIEAKYGGSRDYGPPSHAQNFFEYIKPSVYYKNHPDWFLVDDGRLLMNNGVVNEFNSQLSLGNKAMREEFLKLLRENIRTSRQAAIAQGLPPFDVYSVSQNDGGTSFVGPEHKELVKREGSDAAAIIDFVNFLADGIKDEFPTVFIDTLAYNQSEKAPKTLRPRDNVIIRLADTQSNLLLPVTAERNRIFRDNVKDWARITKHLRIWDYDVTFTDFNMNLPTPTIRTFAPDLQFLQKNNVTGMFIEYHQVVLADMRDLKLWVLAKLLEDPRRSTDALVRDFTDGFYGPAGPAVRRYLTALDKVVDKTAASSGMPEVAWFAALSQFNYLTRDFLVEADVIFNKAEASVANNPTLARRLRHARFSVDNAIMMRYPRLIGDWVRSGNTPESFPLNAAAVAARMTQTWNEQIDFRLEGVENAKQKEVAKNQMAALIAAARYLSLPDHFTGIPADKILTYGFADSKVYGENYYDPEAPSGNVRRLLIADNQIEQYRMPSSWGVYADVETTTLTQGTIKAEDVPNSGYNWYKLGTVKPTASSYVFFTWSWYLQFVIGDAVDVRNPNQEVELWANLKFAGPLFPHGSDKDKNAVLLDRLVAIKR